MMMPVEWPIAAPAADHPVDLAPSAGADRLSTVRADFFVDEKHRLSEQERALIGGMLSALVDQLIDELLLGLPPLLAHKAEAARQAVSQRLWRQGALNRPELFALLLRRSDEQRVAGRAGPKPSAVSPVEALVGDDDEAIAAAAMALTVARGRRRDRFGRLGIELDDLRPDEVEALVHLVAAAVRLEARLGHPGDDLALAAAAAALIARQDDADRLEQRVATLAETLHRADRSGDDAVARFAESGDVALIAALLAVRAGIDPLTGWCLLVEEGAAEIMLLARLAGLERAAAARLIAALAEPLGAGDVAAAIEQFDRWSDGDVDDTRRWWQLPPGFRAALTRLGTADGQRPD
jgi:hypothetical protein